MDAFPHVYTVSARSGPSGSVETSAEGKPDLPVAPPRQFDGPGDQWSPEDLLVAAVVDCFILTFRAVARASGLGWQALACSVDGTLDKTDGVTRFTELSINARLSVEPGMSADKAERLLHKAEAGCLITHSLSAVTRLNVLVVQGSVQTPETEVAH